MHVCAKFIVVYVCATLCWRASYSEKQDQYYRHGKHPKLLYRPYRHARPWPNTFHFNLGSDNTEGNRGSGSELRGVDAMSAGTDTGPIFMVFPPVEEESHIPQGRAVQPLAREDAVSFPKQDTSFVENSNPKKIVWVPNVTKNCENDVLCDDVPNYPEHAIKSKVLSQMGQKTFAIGDAEPSRQNINVRIRPVQATMEETLCETTEIIRYPRSARSATNDSWRFIINQSNFTQGVKVETCKSPNQPCKYAKHFPFEVRTVCRQKYAARKLLAITENGETINDTFNLPSCCVCYVISEPNIAQRNFKPQQPRQEPTEELNPNFS